MPAAIKTAVILAAGLGTRLRPLTYQVPKPLFPILNRPLLGLLLDQLAAAGCQRLAVNTHHHGRAIRDFVNSQSPWFQEVLVRHEPEILGTGGGLRNLADFLGERPFLVINGDIVTDVNLVALWQAHDEAALATLLLHDYRRFNNVWLNAKGQIQGFGPSPRGEVLPRPLAYTGIQVVSPRLFQLIPAGEFVDIITIYRQAIAAGDKVAAFVGRNFFWQDIGTPRDYLGIHNRLLHGEIARFQRFFPPVSDPFLGANVVLGSGINLAGGVCLGAGVRLGNGVGLKNTVVWDGATLAPGVILEDCVVSQNARVEQSARGRCILP